MLKLGSHISFSKSNNYLLGAAKEAISYNANAMMIYLGAPQNTRRANPEDMFLKEYEEEYMNQIPKENIMVHAPYIINPSSVEKHEFAIEFLIKEFKIMNYLGLKEIVLHPGNYTKFSKDESIQVLINSLKTVISKTKDVTILLETMSGKGTEIGTSLEELKYIIDQVGSKRVGICLDTCHMWDSGVDVNDFVSFIKSIKDLKLIELIKCIHINDSKNDIGSKKDRHANLGQGFIKTSVLKQIVHAPEFNNIIKVLETPFVDKKPIYKEEIEILK